MKKYTCKREKSGIKKRRNVRSIRVLPITKSEDYKSLPVYRYDEHNEILEEMANKALEILNS